MIKIKPSINHISNCPRTGEALKPKEILWQGILVCVKSYSNDAVPEIIDVLRVGHGLHTFIQVDLEKKEIFSGDSRMAEWLGKPLLYSLQNPRLEKLEITKEIFKECKRVIILNCIDYLYGHSLLKLLNAQRHLDKDTEYGLIVITPKFLRWMVPKGVAEIWTVPISLKNGFNYYPSFSEFIDTNTERFDEIYVSKAHSHPSQFDITRFTGVPKHNFEEKEVKITFVWREDRLLINYFLFRVLRNLNCQWIALLLQNLIIQQVFKKIRSEIPNTKFAVAGLGTKTKFPKWIKDYRVNNFNEKIEREICSLYAESRLVIGLHGSNMLLPSGHAGMTIDLIDGRWGNFAQDVLYQERDPKMASFRYRFLPFQTKPSTIGYIAAIMIQTLAEFKAFMTADVDD